MNRILRIIIPIMLMPLLFSCAHYHNINGHLDGQWQFMSIDLPDGTQETPASVYYCIQMHTMNLTSPGHGVATANMVYDKENGTLNLEFPYDGNLSFGGLPDAPCTVTFDILDLNKQHLVMSLKPDGKIFTFRKF